MGIYKSSDLPYGLSYPLLLQSAGTRKQNITYKRLSLENCFCQRLHKIGFPAPWKKDRWCQTKPAKEQVSLS